MGIVQLVYASNMVRALSMHEVVAILDAARYQNARCGITGVLTFTDKHFLQLLEGPPLAVNALYAKLLQDPRHANLMLISYADVAERSFADWSMGFFRLDDHAQDILQPDALSAHDAVEHLTRLSRAVSSVTKLDAAKH